MIPDLAITESGETFELLMITNIPYDIVEKS